VDHQQTVKEEAGRRESGPFSCFFLLCSIGQIFIPDALQNIAAGLAPIGVHDANTEVAVQSKQQTMRT
jgi:hypothetical protein